MHHVQIENLDLDKSEPVDAVHLGLTKKTKYLKLNRLNSCFRFLWKANGSKGSNKIVLKKELS